MSAEEKFETGDVGQGSLIEHERPFVRKKLAAHEKGSFKQEIGNKR